MTKKIFIILILTLFVNNISYTDNSGSNENKDTQIKSGNEAKLEPYDKRAYKIILSAKKLDKKGKTERAKKKYKKALDFFLKSYDKNPNDPDLLNQIAFASSRLDRLEHAEIYYLLGLEIEPKHNEINRYLGELYIDTNRTDLAKEKLSILKECNCKEYEELKELIEGKKN